MNRSDIRVKAMAIFRRDDKILVSEIAESDGTVVGYRIPGGHVEFNEYAVDTLRREIKEEFNAEIDNIRLLHVLENMFIYNGQPGHEIVFIYEAEFVDRSFYEQDEIKACEDSGAEFTLFWMDPNHPPGELKILPSGFDRYLNKNPA